MPVERAALWIAAGLVALGPAWVVLAALGLSPARWRLRRRVRESGSGGLICGRCGHPAVDLGRIDACPECGAAYAKVGLDAAATGARWAPPLLLLVVVLFGACSIGTMLLAPLATSWINTKTLGGAVVQRSRVIEGYTALPVPADLGAPPSVAIEVHQVLLSPCEPGKGAVGGPLPGSEVRVRASMGAATTNAVSLWQSAWNAHPANRFIHFSSTPYSATPAPPPPPQPPPVSSPWDTLFASSPAHELVYAPSRERWRLLDHTGALVASGEGLEAGLTALFVRSRLDDPARPQWAGGSYARDVLFGRLSTALAPRSQQSGWGWASGYSGDPWLSGSPTPIGGILERHAPLRDASTTHLYHRSAPWGLVAAASVTLGLLAIGATIFWLARRSKRAAFGPVV